MKCKKCGKEITDGVQFCQYCGCPQETAKAHTGEAAEMKKRYQLKTKVVIIALVILCLVAGGEIFWYMQKEQELKQPLYPFLDAKTDLYGYIDADGEDSVKQLWNFV